MRADCRDGVRTEVRAAAIWSLQMASMRVLASARTSSCDAEPHVLNAMVRRFSCTARRL